METWKLSVKEWSKIIDLLQNLNIPTTISFSTFTGHKRTNLYAQAKRLRRKKISPTHRRIIPKTIKNIKNKCINKQEKQEVTINIVKSLCNLIRSQTLPT
jgi:hypothetical protein